MNEKNNVYKYVDIEKVELYGHHLMNDFTIPANI